MIRIRRDDFEDAGDLARYAAAAGMTVDGFRREFSYLTEDEAPALELLEAPPGGDQAIERASGRTRS